MDEISPLIDGLPRLAAVPSRAGTVGPVPDAPPGWVTQQRTGAYIVNTERWLALLDLPPPRIWPGALVQGASAASGRFAPIELPRGAGAYWLRDECDGSTPLRIEVAAPSAAAASALRREADPLIARQAASPHRPHANTAVTGGRRRIRLAFAATLREGMVRLGIAGSPAGEDGSLDAGLDRRFDDRTLLLLCTQVACRIGFEPHDARSGAVFAPEVGRAQLGDWVSPTNPPLLVAQVAYGRAALLAFTAPLPHHTLAATAAAVWQWMDGAVDARRLQPLDAMRIRTVSLDAQGAARCRVLHAPERDQGHDREREREGGSADAGAGEGAGESEGQLETGGAREPGRRGGLAPNRDHGSDAWRALREHLRARFGPARPLPAQPVFFALDHLGARDQNGRRVPAIVPMATHAGPELIYCQAPADDRAADAATRPPGHQPPAGGSRSPGAV